MKKLIILALIIVAVFIVSKVASPHSIFTSAPTPIPTKASSSPAIAGSPPSGASTSTKPLPVKTLPPTTTSTSSPQATPTTPSLSVTPKSILQGDPDMITIQTIATTTISSATITRPDGTTETLHFTSYGSVLVAFYGSSINEKTGTAKVSAILKDGRVLSSSFTITTRTQPSESLPVPAQLGGNSTSSQQALVSNLETENAEIAAVYSNPTTAYWTSAFAFPVKSPIVVTDPYGYDRESGAETIVHKGTDFKAPPGTPVYAINTGVVRTTKLYTVYGNTVIVDHGVGILSFYMHLTSMNVTVGQKVTKGQLLGYSGETGYAEGPHLHLTIRVGGQSIDPMKFYALFGVEP